MTGSGGAAKRPRAKDGIVETAVGSGRWRATVQTGVGRGAPRLTQTFSTKGEARRWQTDMRAQVQRGTWVDPRHGDVLLSVHDAAARPALPLRSSARDPRQLRLLPRPGPAAAGGPAAGPAAPAAARADAGRPAGCGVDQGGDARGAGDAAEGGRRRRAAGRQPNEWAAPAGGATQGSARPGPQAAAAAPGGGGARGRPLLLTAVGAGLRQGELFGVRRHRIDFRRRTLAVEEQVTSGKGRPPALTSTLKAPASRRRVPLPDAVLRALAAELEARPDADALFLTPRTKSLWRRQHFNDTVWKPTLRAAKLDETLGVHVLRHTYASHLIAATRRAAWWVLDPCGHGGGCRWLSSSRRSGPDPHVQALLRLVPGVGSGQRRRHEDRTGRPAEGGPSGDSARRPRITGTSQSTVSCGARPARVRC